MGSSPRARSQDQPRGRDQDHGAVADSTRRSLSTSRRASSAGGGNRWPTGTSEHRHHVRCGRGARSRLHRHGVKGHDLVPHGKAGALLPEAFAEYMHERIRTDFWGYASNEKLRFQSLIKGNIKALDQPQATPPAQTIPLKPICSSYYSVKRLTCNSRTPSP